MKVMTAAALAAILWSGAALARDLPIADPQAVSAVFTPAQIGAILTQSGFTFAQQTARSGDPVFIVTAPGGARFVAGLTVCGDSGADCLGLHLFAVFEAQSNSATLALTNDFQAGYPFAKAFLTRNGLAVIARYVIADGGVSNANIYYNLTNFLASAQEFQYALAGPQAMSGSGSSTALAPHALPADLSAMVAALPASARNTGRVSFTAPSSR